MPRTTAIVRAATGRAQVIASAVLRYGPAMGAGRDVGFGRTVPMAVAVVLATALARRVDGYSIYSARLSTITP